jgi:hypothetical protein
MSGVLMGNGTLPSIQLGAFSPIECDVIQCNRRLIGIVQRQNFLKLQIISTTAITDYKYMISGFIELFCFSPFTQGRRVSWIECVPSVWSHSVEDLKWLMIADFSCDSNVHFENI